MSPQNAEQVTRALRQIHTHQTAGNERTDERTFFFFQRVTNWAPSRLLRLALSITHFSFSNNTLRIMCVKIMSERHEVSRALMFTAIWSLQI